MDSAGENLDGVADVEGGKVHSSRFIVEELSDARKFRV
jgi:hypothetical protein